MSDETKAALVNAAVARATIRAMGMQAENARHLHVGMQAPHGQADFEALIQDEGISWNNVIAVLHG